MLIDELYEFVIASNREWVEEWSLTEHITMRNILEDATALVHSGSGNVVTPRCKRTRVQVLGKSYDSFDTNFLGQDI